MNGTHRRTGVMLLKAMLVGVAALGAAFLLLYVLLALLIAAVVGPGNFPFVDRFPTPSPTI